MSQVRVAKGWDRQIVSVIIVNFNGGELLSRCVRSVLSSNIPLEIFVSDNGSTDCSVALLRSELSADPRLSVIERRQNLGFSRANNLATKWATGDYILYLNPDCIIRQDTLSRMLAVMASYPEARFRSFVLAQEPLSERPGFLGAIFRHVHAGRSGA